MKYGYFDDKNREYVIARLAPQKLWSDYIGNSEFEELITNNAGDLMIKLKSDRLNLMRFVKYSFLTLLLLDAFSINNYLTIYIVPKNSIKKCRIEIDNKVPSIQIARNLKLFRLVLLKKAL